MNLTLLERSKLFPWGSFRRRIFEMGYRMCEWAVCSGYKYDHMTGTYQKDSRL